MRRKDRFWAFEKLKRLSFADLKELVECSLAVCRNEQRMGA